MPRTRNATHPTPTLRAGREDADIRPPEPAPSRPRLAAMAHRDRSRSCRPRGPTIAATSRSINAVITCRAAPTATAIRRGRRRLARHARGFSPQLGRLPRTRRRSGKLSAGAALSTGTCSTLPAGALKPSRGQLRRTRWGPSWISTSLGWFPMPTARPSNPPRRSPSSSNASRGPSTQIFSRKPPRLARRRSRTTCPPPHHAAALPLDVPHREFDFQHAG